MTACRRAGVYVPNDVLVLDHDDLNQGPGIAPKLTTVRQPGAEPGQKAVRLLSQVISESGRETRRVVLQPQL